MKTTTDLPFIISACPLHADLTVFIPYKYKPDLMIFYLGDWIHHAASIRAVFTSAPPSDPAPAHVCVSCQSESPPYIFVSSASICVCYFLVSSLYLCQPSLSLPHSLHIYH